MLRRNFMIHEALCYVKEKETVVCAFSLRRSFDMTFPYHLVMMKRMNEDKWGEKTNAKVAQKKFDVMRNQLYFLALRSIINWGCWCVCSVPVFIVLWRHCRESQVGSFPGTHLSYLAHFWECWEYHKGLFFWNICFVSGGLDSFIFTRFSLFCTKSGWFENSYFWLENLLFCRMTMYGMILFRCTIGSQGFQAEFWPRINVWQHWRLVWRGGGSTL